MIHRAMTTALVLGALVFSPAGAAADDVDDLKAAAATVRAALGQLDGATVNRHVHDQYVSYAGNAVFASEGKAPDNFFDAFEVYQLDAVNEQALVIGRTGILWGNNLVTVKPKGGSPETFSNRCNIAHSKVGREWLLVGSHCTTLTVGMTN